MLNSLLFLERLSRVSLFAVHQLSDVGESAQRVTPFARSTLERIDETNMRSLGLDETHDLESWIVNNPGIIDSEMEILITQFSSWMTGANNKSQKRPDVLGLDAEGNLVVIELKRSEDKEIHLQAISYAAMCSKFTYESLAQAHLNWLNGKRKLYSPDSADDANEQSSRIETVDAVIKWFDGVTNENVEIDPLTSPPVRIVLVAEGFAPETISAAEWLTQEGSKINIECIEYSVHRRGVSDIFVEFSSLYPFPESGNFVLSPYLKDEDDQAGVRNSGTRKVKATSVLLAEGVIPEGHPVTLDLQSFNTGKLNEDELNQVRERAQALAITWTNNTSNGKPLYVEKLSGHFAPGGLVKQILGDLNLTKPDLNLPSANQFVFIEGKDLGYWSENIEEARRRIVERPTPAADEAALLAPAEPLNAYSDFSNETTSF